VQVAFLNHSEPLQIPASHIIDSYYILEAISQFLAKASYIYSSLLGPAASYSQLVGNFLSYFLRAAILSQLVASHISRRQLS
jgi:hypothetical protein